MVEGFPNEGAMPSGQVAGIITNLPACEELVTEIMRDFDRACEKLDGIRR
jgi:NAD(P)H-dependent flavin oxidoreductase YrpB (nitropropane dioxygenase family)